MSCFILTLYSAATGYENYILESTSPRAVISAARLLRVKLRPAANQGTRIAIFDFTKNPMKPLRSWRVDVEMREEADVLRWRREGGRR